ncbi:GntR family transcriptional regulator [uncultured Draconibacterium sp.]|uniref:GntR family transcriptional regulator n=1 Tax=uncultured Draconibacterium sp. TaxID=1573823 RepID=UPI0025F3D1BF|nr:GntR family transcriptional regulator [uncultured Draconibacterium sp.]
MPRRRVISINAKSAVPKYRQIIDSVQKSIEKRHLKKGDKVPSINQICSEFNLSRDTVMFAFNELKSKGILKSQPGKGYYIASTEIKVEERVFVLFDELNAFKEDLYNSLINSLKGKATVEVYFHHFNYKVFKNLITESIGNYTSYLIMPATFDNTGHLLSKLPQDRVYIIDRLKPELSKYPVVYQDFEQDFYDALVEGKEMIEKYRKLVFVNPGGKEPAERSEGFKRFCEENDFRYEIVKSLTGVKPSLWEAYFLISDRDLVEMVKIAKYCKFKLGKKFGVVSFNDTMLKEVVSGGITTISTDFTEMGKTLANMVVTRDKSQVRNKARMIVRNSL